MVRLTRIPNSMSNPFFFEIGVPIKIEVFPLMPSDGLINLESPHSVPETADRLQNLLVAKGMKIFARD